MSRALGKNDEDLIFIVANYQTGNTHDKSRLYLIKSICAEFREKLEREGRIKHFVLLYETNLSKNENDNSNEYLTVCRDWVQFWIDNQENLAENEDLNKAEGLVKELSILNMLNI